MQHTTIRLRLMPDTASGQLLRKTLEVCNAEANRISQVAHERNIRNQFDLQKVVYGEAKAAIGAAQPVCLTVSKVHGAIAAHKANIRNGNRGKKGSARRAKAEATVIQFRPDASQPYDQRTLSLRIDDKIASIWVTDTGAGKPGRLKIPFTCWDRHADQLREAAKILETDLVRHHHGWYLHVTIATPKPQTSLPVTTTPSDWLGIDMGLENLAYDSDNHSFTGKTVDATRTRRLHNRTWAQQLLSQPNNRTAHRLLKSWSGRERRFATDTNHRISKSIVQLAYRTNRGIALETLDGIRDRARHRKPQRTRFHSWAFRQLGEFIVYKAAQLGVPVVFVNPAYTSQTCHQCGNRDKKARTTQALYKCSNASCAYAGHADHNAAINIQHLAPEAWQHQQTQAVSHAA
ncbi:RNA-guided endonuclease TnpB family protein [Yaniella flava]|uniref:RNA-guided endonuclease TnpB family protein n=1 Tax=Yaniella flava TaxID=287930 RepID=A0ABP5FYC3_9MICC